MKMIKTKSFELAVYQKGDESADKLALVLPGRLDSKDYASMTSLVDYLATRGYLAISFDPPGSWESPGTTADYTTTNYIKAVNELIAKFNKPTFLIGHSRGGAVSILVGAQNSKVVAIAPIMASYGGATGPRDKDIAAGIYTTFRDLPPGASRTGDRKFSLPLSYFEDSQKYNAEMEIKKFKGPKLLISATNDKYTPPEKVRKVFDDLAKPKMLIELNTTHDYRYYPDMIEAVKDAVGKFLDKYLPA